MTGGVPGRRRPRPRPRDAWRRRLFASALLFWPREYRGRFGADLVGSALRAVDEGASLVGEVLSIAREGVRLRLRSMGNDVAALLSLGRSEFRLALRSLLKSPGFTAIAIATLTIAIGATTAVFAVVDSVLLKPLPYGNPDELAFVWAVRSDGSERTLLSGPDAAVVRESLAQSAGVAFVGRPVEGAIEVSGRGEHVRIAAVTPNLFELLGVAPAIGGGFGDGGGVPSAILAHATWERLFGADPATVGRTIRLNGGSVTVAGVLPPSFEMRLPSTIGVRSGVGIWIPLAVPLEELRRTDDRLLDQDSDNGGVVIVRLHPSATRAGVEGQATVLTEMLRERSAAFRRGGYQIEVRGMKADSTADQRALLLALLTSALGVYLIAGLNLSTLLLARGAARAEEYRVRSALGQSRPALLLQLGAESALLAVGGWLTAISILAVSGGAALQRVPDALSAGVDLALHPTTLVFSAALAAVSAGVGLLLPALQAGVSRRRPPGPSTRTTVGDRAGLRRRLVVAQVALSLTLALGASLLFRTVEELGAVHPGFEPEGALTFDLAIRSPERYSGPADRARLMAQIAEDLSRLPGVVAVGWIGVLPLGGERWTQPYGLPGQPRDTWSDNRADFQVASSSLPEALGMRLIAGRSFHDVEDLHEEERVVLVDERMAARIVGVDSDPADAVGARIGIPLDGSAVDATVVGVLGSVRGEALDRPGREAIYVPYRQEASRDVSFVVRSAAEPAALADAVRRTLAEIDPEIPVYRLRPLVDYWNAATSDRRFTLTVLGTFALVGLLGAGLGIYGIMAFEVGRRRREIGLRLAIGERRSKVLYRVLKDGLGLAGLGVVLGLVVGLPVLHLGGALYYGVVPTDASSVTTAVALVLAISTLATIRPALHASRLDPAGALRHD